MPIVISLYQKLLEGVALDAAEMTSLRALSDAAKDLPALVQTVEHHTVTANVTNEINTVDPTGGDIVLTLPVASTVTGQSFTFKRYASGANSVSIASTEMINNYNSPVLLSHRNDSMTLFSDGTNYCTSSAHRSSIARLTTAAPTTQGIGIAYTKHASWDTANFSSAGRLVSDATTDDITILDFPSGLSVDVYWCDFSLTFEYTTNRFVGVQFFANGALVGQEAFSNGLGGGKPVTLTLKELLPVTSNTTIEVHLIGEIAGTLTITASSFIAERLRG